MLAPTKTNNTNEIDQEYILDQFNTVSKLWIAVIKSKSTIKIARFIVFVNKCDLFDNRKQELKELFGRHIKLIEAACKEKGIKFEAIVGSSVKRDGISRMEESFLKM